jgi:hypothetical protein
MKTQHLSWPTFAELAEHHLGSDFFSLAEIENAYECSYTPAQKDIMTASAPTTLMLLFAQRHRCTLMPTPPVEYNLFEFYALSQAEVGPEEECWFQSEFLSFSHNELLPACRWLMVGKHPRLFSPQKTWSDQKELVTRLNIFRQWWKSSMPSLPCINCGEYGVWIKWHCALRRLICAVSISPLVISISTVLT